MFTLCVCPAPTNPLNSSCPSPYKEGRQVGQWANSACAFESLAQPGGVAGEDGETRDGYRQL